MHRLAKRISVAQFLAVALHLLALVFIGLSDAPIYQSFIVLGVGIYTTLFIGAIYRDVEIIDRAFEEQ